MKDKKIKFSKNKIMTIILLFLFGICCYMNTKFLGKNNAKILGEAQYVSSNAEVTEDAFSENRLEIEKARDSEISHLKSIMESTLTQQEAKDEAQKIFFELTKNIEKEGICQEQIKLKTGFDNLVVLNNGQATINVKTTNLLPTDIAKIQEIILSHTEITLNCIKIKAID